MSENQPKSFISKYGSLCLSVVALGMSGYTFWRTQFYDPDLSFTTGEALSLGHANQGNGQVVVPIVAMNRGSKPQVIKRVLLRITPPSGQGSYRLTPYYYQKIRADGGFDNESEPEPIFVQGDAMALKYVWFVSSQARPFRFAEPGVYKAQILTWMREAGEPTVAHEFEFVVDSSHLRMIAPNNNNLTRIGVRRYERWAAGPEAE